MSEAFKDPVATWQGRLGGLIGFTLGLFVIVWWVVSMHQSAARRGELDAAESRVIEINREQRQRERVVKPAEPPPPRPQQTPRAPLPQIDSLLAGLDLGIPEFAVSDIGGSGQGLLGEVSRGGIMDESSVDSAPRVISRTSFTFPRNAIKKGVNGYVLLNLLINESGEIEAAKVLEAKPKGVFEAAALRGIQGWRFAPARYNGNPVKVWAKQRVRFDANR